jgi:hypothetical protein
MTSMFIFQKKAFFPAKKAIRRITAAPFEAATFVSYTLSAMAVKFT